MALDCNLESSPLWVSIVTEILESLLIKHLFFSMLLRFNNSLSYSHLVWIYKVVHFRVCHPLVGLVKSQANLEISLMSKLFTSQVWPGCTRPTPGWHWCTRLTFYWHQYFFEENYIEKSVCFFLSNPCLHSSENNL